MSILSVSVRYREGRSRIVWYRLCSNVDTISIASIPNDTDNKKNRIVSHGLESRLSIKQKIKMWLIEFFINKIPVQLLFRNLVIVF